MKRLYNLDYLRGLAAFSIMIYHYISWTFGEFPADTFLGRIGIYGVSIFYILSGLTLFYVYQNKMVPSETDVKDFFKKRIFRIFPLLWLVTLFSIVLSREMPGITKLILNLTGLFGIVNWDSYYATGAWSIGNELVFYLFFPFFILFTKRSKWALGILSTVLLGVYLYFAFHILSANTVLSEQWRNYINPLNQVFLFLGGFLIGLFFQRVEMNKYVIASIFVAGLCLFVFYPATGDMINLVTGINRIIFTMSCFFICTSFYKAEVKLPLVLHNPLKLLGEASYSVYLLHPLVLIVVSAVNKRIFHLSDPLNLTVSVVVTLIISYFVYEYFEKYFMKISKTKTTNMVPSSR